MPSLWRPFFSCLPGRKLTKHCSSLPSEGLMEEERARDMMVKVEALEMVAKATNVRVLEARSIMERDAGGWRDERESNTPATSQVESYLGFLDFLSGSRLPMPLMRLEMEAVLPMGRPSKPMWTFEMAERKVATADWPMSLFLWAQARKLATSHTGAVNGSTGGD